MSKAIFGWHTMPTLAVTLRGYTPARFTAIQSLILARRNGGNRVIPNVGFDTGKRKLHWLITGVYHHFVATRRVGAENEVLKNGAR
jgi:hypothetical protein